MMEVMRSNLRRIELPMEDVIVANALLFADDDDVAEGVTAGGTSILPTSSDDDVGCGCGPGLGVGVVVVMNREVIMVNQSLV
jgi:hypothetical protein